MIDSVPFALWTLGFILLASAMVTRHEQTHVVVARRLGYEATVRMHLFAGLPFAGVTTFESDGQDIPPIHIILVSLAPAIMLPPAAFAGWLFYSHQSDFPAVWFAALVLCFGPSFWDYWVASKAAAQAIKPT